MIMYPILYLCRHCVTHIPGRALLWALLYHDASGRARCHQLQESCSRSCSVLGLPPHLDSATIHPEGPGITCSVDWTAKTANNISYIICLFIVCLILPFLVIVYSYGKLLHAIKQVRHLVWFKKLEGYTGYHFTLYWRVGLEVIMLNSNSLDSHITGNPLTRVYILYSCPTLNSMWHATYLLFS